MSWKKADPTQTLHSTNCNRAFSHKDMTCPRCIELANGAVPRAGWSDWKRKMEAQSIAAIKAHNCQQSNCMSVCTFGDW